MKLSKLTIIVIASMLLFGCKIASRQTTNVSEISNTITISKYQQKDTVVSKKAFIVDEDFLDNSTTTDCLFFSPDKSIIYLMDRSPIDLYGDSAKNLYNDLDPYRLLYLHTEPCRVVPWKNDTRYGLQWLVYNDKLYLMDFIFYLTKPLEEIYTNKEHYKRMETLTQNQFITIKGVDKQVMFAEWFTGSIKVKETRKRNEECSSWKKKELNVLEFEKGVLVKKNN